MKTRSRLSRIVRSGWSTLQRIGRLSPASVINTIALGAWRVLRIRLSWWVVIGVAAVAVLYRGAWTPIVRDVVIAHYAHARAGPIVPFDPGYSESVVWTPPGAEDLGRWATWGVETNSPWILRYTKLIVPYMAYEGLTSQVVYPDSSIFEPRAGTDSFLNGGYAIVPNLGRIIVSVNDRYVDDMRMNDARSVLSVLVHELVHIQGGDFLARPDEEIRDTKGNVVAWREGTSARLESATEAATQEILAAMCNFGDKLACRSFWMNLEDLARGDLMYRAMKARVPWVYEAWSNLSFRNRDQEIASAKRMRYWNRHWFALMEQLEKYNVRAWSQVRDGICGQPLNTGLTQMITPGRFFILGLDFDDTRLLLGRSGIFLRLWC